MTITTPMVSKPPSFSVSKFGFLRQDPDTVQKFVYDDSYKKKQSTTVAMCWLRIGWLAAQVPFETLRTWHVVDVGSGNGSFVQEGKEVFKSCVGFDLEGESITEAELYGNFFNLVILTDVLEHFDDVDSLFAMNFEWALISYPEKPPAQAMPDLTGWRHNKPSEHLWILNKESFTGWATAHGCEVVAYGTPEDMIRTRWNPDYPNISTFLLHRIEKV